MLSDPACTVGSPCGPLVPSATSTTSTDPGWLWKQALNDPSTKGELLDARGLQDFRMRGMGVDVHARSVSRHSSDVER